MLSSFTSYSLCKPHRGRQGCDLLAVSPLFLMSFFQKEMRRIDDIPSEPPIPLSALEDPEVRKYMVELQRSMICWEPWLLKTWSMEKIGSLGLNGQYCETLEMTSHACLESLEKYTELYQRFRDHNEFTFEEFFRETLKMAEKQGFEWEGPMDDLPPTPSSFD